MGQTIATWRSKVRELIRDAGGIQDLTDAQIDTVGIKPAVVKYTIDRPRVTYAQAAGAGSAYLSLPAGWLAGFSRVESVEYPANLNPPTLLDAQSWRMVRSVADVAVEQILLNQAAATGQTVRVGFTTRWPLPTTDATVDLLDEVAFEAVAALAASKCITALATQAARNRVGALPNDITEDRSRADKLLAAAKSYLATYNAFLGLFELSAGDRAAQAPASRPMDFDPQSGSLFHGGRR